MIKIGITGSLASGKSTASKFLSGKRGPLFSADSAVKELYKSSSFKSLISKKFKIKNNNHIKKNLKKIIFYNSAELKKMYKDYFEEWDSLFENLIRINFVHSYLKDRGIKSYHILSESQYHSENGDYFEDFNLKDINLKTFNWQEDFQIDDALDKPHPHPGLLSHKLIATNIQKWLFS